MAYLNKQGGTRSSDLCCLSARIFLWAEDISSQRKFLQARNRPFCLQPKITKEVLQPFPQESSSRSGCLGSPVHLYPLLFHTQVLKKIQEDRPTVMVSAPDGQEEILASSPNKDSPVPGSNCSSSCKSVTTYSMNAERRNLKTKDYLVR